MAVSAGPSVYELVDCSAGDVYSVVYGSDVAADVG